MTGAGSQVTESASRREDARFLHGTGRYLDDLSVAGLHHIAFVRSTVAHGILHGVTTAEAFAMPGVTAVLTGRDLSRRLGHLAPSKADGGVFEEKLLSQLGDSRSFIRREARPPIAVDRVRHVGEIISVVIADDPYRAEDAAERVGVDISELDPVVDPGRALEDGSPLLYDHWPDNRSLHLHVSKGDIDTALARARTVSRRRLHSGRVSANPIEPRGAMAAFDSRTGHLTVWSSTQIPHPVRTFLADALGLPAGCIRVIAPDVGGGFGCKAIPYPEELLCAVCALDHRVPVKWVEDRWEHFTSAIHSRDQIHDIEIGLDEDGRILGVRDNFIVDTGAANPLGVVQPYNTIAHLCGCYEVPTLEATATAVVTNKAPLSPYRGAGRPEAVFAMERILDVAARQAGMDPFELRRRNLIPAGSMPYEVGFNYRDGNPIVYDSGDFPACFERAVTLAGVPSEPTRSNTDSRGRRIGVGVATYVEGTGVGPFEGALVRMDETGHATVAVGACPQGQGHETVFAHLAATALGMKPTDVHVITGDTDAVPYGWGTLASRSAVVAGSAVYEAATDLRRRILATVAADWEISVDDLEIVESSVRVAGTPTRTLSLNEIAAEFSPGQRRARTFGPGLESVSYWEPPTVTFASGTHVARVAVDTETGIVEIIGYVVVHDCGPLLAPAIVEGQITGGVAQGIGAALYEEIRYDHDGQPINPNLMDYLLPTSDTVPDLVISHLQTPSPLNPLGIKGVGEAGAIAPPAAVANAIENALQDLGVSIDKVPVSPGYLLEQLAVARVGKGSGFITDRGGPD